MELIGLVWLVACVVGTVTFALTVGARRVGQHADAETVRDAVAVLEVLRAPESPDGPTMQLPPDVAQALIEREPRFRRAPVRVGMTRSS